MLMFIIFGESSLEKNWGILKSYDLRDHLKKPFWFFLKKKKVIPMFVTRLNFGSQI